MQVSGRIKEMEVQALTFASSPFALLAIFFGLGTVDLAVGGKVWV